MAKRTREQDQTTAIGYVFNRIKTLERRLHALRTIINQQPEDVVLIEHELKLMELVNELWLLEERAIIWISKCGPL
jgi:hypothetical protein